MIPSRWNRRGRMTRRSLTSARAASFAIGLFAASGCVAFVAGCGSQPSPTAPDVNPGVSPSLPTVQTHIRGSVSDTVRRPLPGALVAVLDGPLAGTTKLTDAEGKFELTGTAAGTATLRVSRDGFQTKTQSVLWRTPTSGAGVDGFIQLDTLEPPIGLDPGDYTLTIAIDLATAVNHPGIPKAPCVGFPVNLASFTYEVQILEGNYGRYVRDGNRPLHFEGLFGFSVAGRFVGFEIDDGIPQDVPGFRLVNINGVAPTSEPAVATGSSVSIPFYGEFRVLRDDVPTRHLQRLLASASRADRRLPLVHVGPRQDGLHEALIVHKIRKLAIRLRPQPRALIMAVQATLMPERYDLRREVVL